MRQNRFFGDFDLAQKNLLISDREFCHQIKSVLRLKEGEEIILVDGQGQEAVARLKKSGRDAVGAEVLLVRNCQNESQRQVILYCSILKRENFELVAQKAVEVGVSEVTPLLC